MDEEEAKGFMLKMGGSKRGEQFSLMYEDFQKKLVGLPHDFYSMALHGEEAVARLERPRNAVGKLIPSTAPDSAVSEAMARNMRSKVYNQDAARILPKEIVQSIFQVGPNVKEIDEPMLWSTMRRLGVHVSKEQMTQIMRHFDFRVLGRLDINEFLTELLRVPLAKSIPLHLLKDRPPLRGDAAELFQQFRHQCERLAVAGGRSRSLPPPSLSLAAQ